MKKLFAIIFVLLIAGTITTVSVNAGNNSSIVGSGAFCYKTVDVSLKAYCGMGQISQCDVYLGLYKEHCNNDFTFTAAMLIDFENLFKYNTNTGQQIYTIINKLRDRAGHSAYGVHFNDFDNPYINPSIVGAFTQYPNNNGVNIVDILNGESAFFQFASDEAQIVNPGITNPTSLTDPANQTSDPVFFSCADKAENCTTIELCSAPPRSAANWYNDSCHTDAQKATGLACNVNYECQTNKCVAGDQGKKCTCETMSDCKILNPDRWCNKDTSMCIDKQPAGAASVHGYACLGGLMTDSADNNIKKCTCTVGSTQGCPEGKTCQSLFSCVNTAQYNPDAGKQGAVCQTNNQCESGTCVNNICNCTSHDNCLDTSSYCDIQGDKSCKPKKIGGLSATNAYECLWNWQAGKCGCLEGSPEGCMPGQSCENNSCDQGQPGGSTYNWFEVMHGNDQQNQCCETDPNACFNNIPSSLQDYVKNTESFEQGDTKLAEYNALADACLNTHACSAGDANCEAAPNGDPPESCTSDSNCQNNQFCATYLSPKICFDKGTLNADCGNGNQCLSNKCNNNKCTEPPAPPPNQGGPTLPGKGEICTNEGNNGQCQPGLFCKTDIIGGTPADMNKCIEKLASEQTCNEAAQCISGTCTTSKCTEPTQEQEAKQEQDLNPPPPPPPPPAPESEMYQVMHGNDQQQQCCTSDPNACFNSIPSDLQNYIKNAESFEQGDPQLAEYNALTNACLSQNGCGSNSCSAPQTPICGNGNKEGTEECDDGNKEEADACKNDCKLAAAPANCGNGVHDAGEGCDDGNVVAGDGCSNVCIIEACGNSILDVGEDCDDGNNTAEDGCDPDCKTEPTPQQAYGDKGTNAACQTFSEAGKNDCTSGLYCGEPPSPKECISQQGTNGACEQNYMCFSNNCNDLVHVCENAVQAQGAPGETPPPTPEQTYGSKGENDTCTPQTSSNECSQGFFCDDIQKICTPQLGTGETPCDYSTMCLSNNCNPQNKTCEDAIQPQGSPGDAPAAPKTCAKHDECSSEQYCDFNGDKKCKDKITGGVNCSTYLGTMCKSDICITGVSLCACTDNSHCGQEPGAEQYCVIEDQECKAKSIAGGTCKLHSDCVSTAWCENATTCTADVEAGKDCVTTTGGDEMCPANHKCVEKDVGGVKKTICACTATGCGEGKYCDVTGNKCTDKGAGGALCAPGVGGDASCKSGKCGSDNKCTQPIAGGGEVPVTNLPNFMNTDNPYEVIGNVITFLIGLTGSIALVMFIYGGSLWLISAGREDYVKKGTQTMVWAVIGLAVIFSSYLIIQFIVRFIGGNI
ncbi:hypothetical protein HN858_00295 [Candidatus Falkowbacteria bacterium]|jgi:cysteine-rich repeat protein|nr:hypothetical protein [Candidatus Falkowbacteria bacterium]MBT7348092.1 hypothetical protein [Candidatus Falkowbacteria bacterium]